MPRTPLGGCASGARVRLRRTFRNSFNKGPMLHADPGPTNSLRGPVCPKVFLSEIPENASKTFLSEVFLPKLFGPKVFDFNVSTKISRTPLFYFREIHQKSVKINLLWKNSLLFRKNEMHLGRKPQNIHHFLLRQPVQFSIKTHKSFLHEGQFLTKSAWVSSKVVFILKVLTIMSKHCKSLKNHIFKCALGTGCKL